MTFKLAECSIKMTALLEYLDLKLNTHIYLFIYCFTAQVLEVYRTPGPTACSRTQMLQSQYIASWLSLLNSLAFYSDSSLLLQGVSMMTTSTTDRFSAHYSEWLQYNWVDFYSQIRSRNFDTGWILCQWSFSRFFSNHKKALLLYLLHLHANF